jgi:hypothetical protein
MREVRQIEELGESESYGLQIDNNIDSTEWRQTKRLIIRPQQLAALRELLEGEPGVMIPRSTLTAWTGRDLTDSEVERLSRAIPHSSIPDALGEVAEQFGEGGHCEDWCGLHVEHPGECARK